ncbi:MAG: hypothetical protein R3C14_52360 [Caldilineaceae bacterium]
MSVQVDQPITGKLMPIDVQPKAGLHLPKLANHLDFDTIYGIVAMLIIWGGFFVALARL